MSTNVATAQALIDAAEAEVENNALDMLYAPDEAKEARDVVLEAVSFALENGWTP